jgi:hypothetical protein
MWNPWGSVRIFGIPVPGEVSSSALHAATIPFMCSQKRLRGLSPNFHIHVSESDFYIHRIGPHIFLQQIGRPIMGI